MKTFLEFTFRNDKVNQEDFMADNKKKIMLRALGSIESNNNPKAMNRETTATGEMQMMWSQWENKIRKFSGNPNLTREQFAGDPDLQQRWADYYHDNVLMPEVQKLKTRFPEQLKRRGLTRDDEIAALLHFQGYPNSSLFVRKGIQKETKAKNLKIPEYLDKYRDVRNRLESEEQPEPTPAAPPEAMRTPIPVPLPTPTPKPDLKERLKNKNNGSFNLSENSEPDSTNWVSKAAKSIGDILFPEAHASGGASITPLPQAEEEIPKNVKQPQTDVKTYEEQYPEIKNSLADNKGRHSWVESDSNIPSVAEKTGATPEINKGIEKAQSELDTEARYGKPPPGFTEEEWRSANEERINKEKADAEAAIEAAKIPRWEAIVRGASQGALYEFADEILAGKDTIGGNQTYKQALQEQRAKFAQAAKDRPSEYYLSMLGSAILTSFIPYYGQMGTPLKLKMAANLAKLAPSTVNKAKLADQMVRQAMKTSAATAAGASEASLVEEPLKFATDVGVGAVTGGVATRVLGKATDIIKESKTGQAIGGAIKEAGSNLLFGPNLKWKVPAIRNNPEALQTVKQETIDQIVKEGMDRGLTDGQIANNIGIKYPQLTPDNLQELINPAGRRGTMERVVAGGIPATEFLERPEQMERATRLAETSDVSAEMARARVGVTAAEEAVQQASARRKSVLDTGQKVVKDLVDQVDQLNAALSQETDNIKRAALIRDRDNALAQVAAAKRVNAKREQIDQLETVIETNQKNVEDTIAKVKKQRTAQHLEQAKEISEKLEEQAINLSGQRNTILESLSDKQATPEMIDAFTAVQDDVAKAVSEQGMEDIRDKVLGYAFAGDPRARKITRHIRALQDQEKNKIISAENDKLTKLNENLPIEEQRSLQDLIPIDPADLIPPSQRDVAQALFTANKKISSRDTGNPAASIKRELAEIVQERMGSVNEDLYVTQRALSKIKSQQDTLYKSGLFEGRVVPNVGKTGRVTAVRKPFIKSDIPDFTKLASEYKEELAQVGLPVEKMTRTSAMQPKLGVGAEKLTAESKSAISGATTEINALKDEIKAMQGFMDKLKEQAKTASFDDKVKIDQLQAEASKRIDMYNSKIQGKEEQLKRIQTQYLAPREELAAGSLASAKGEMSTLGETERSLQTTYQMMSRKPIDARDVGQVGVIASQGRIPFNVLKVVTPTPQTRIKAYNAIKRNFQNPSLNAASRAALEKPITIGAIKSLAEMHKVPANELLRVIEESGVEVQPDEE